MMRKIEDLEKINENFDIVNDLKYQKMISLKRVMEESDLPHGVWGTQEKTNGWNEIEEGTWQLLKSASNDYKLLTLWAQSYIKISSLENISFVFDVFAKMFANGIILKDKEKEYCVDILNYIDKHINLALKQVNINLDYKEIAWNNIERFNKEIYGEFYSLLALIKTDSIEKLKNICNAMQSSFELMRENLGQEYIDAFNQIHHLINVLSDFIDLRANISFDQEEAAEEEPHVDENNELKTFAYYRNVAFTAIEEGTQILEKIDQQSIVLPFLKKILKWKDLSLLQIFDDLGDATQIEAFIKILKEK